jgi:hypothetical protein
MIVSMINMMSTVKPKRGIEIPKKSRVSTAPMDHGLLILLGWLKSPGLILFIHERNTPSKPLDQINVSLRENCDLEPGSGLSGVAAGWMNKEIAVKYSISEYTVKNHLKNILQKLQVQNRVQLTR